MNRLVYLIAVLIAAVPFGLSSPSAADLPEQDDGLKRLEKRVADLEKELAELRAQFKLALDNKLDPRLVLPPFEQKGRFSAVAGEEGVANFPFPYAVPPNVELKAAGAGSDPAPTYIVKDVTATGFKWKAVNVGTHKGLYGDVAWTAKGVKATKIPVEEKK